MCVGLSESEHFDYTLPGPAVAIMRLSLSRHLAYMQNILHLYCFDVILCVRVFDVFTVLLCDYCKVSLYLAFLHTFIAPTIGHVHNARFDF